MSIRNSSWTILLALSLTILSQSSHAESHWRRGALIGTGVGAVAGLGTGAGSCAISENWDYGPCLALAGSSLTFVGGVVGFGAGALIGSAFDKEAEETMTGGSHALRGLLIGALSGLAVGGGIATAAATTDCSLSGDPGDCSAIRGIVIVSALTGAPTLGGLIGWGVGAMIPKEEEVVFLPTLSSDGDRTVAGMALTLVF